MIKSSDSGHFISTISTEWSNPAIEFKSIFGWFVAIIISDVKYQILKPKLTQWNCWWRYDRNVPPGQSDKKTITLVDCRAGEISDSQSTHNINHHSLPITFWVLSPLVLPFKRHYKTIVKIWYDPYDKSISMERGKVYFLIWLRI